MSSVKWDYPHGYQEQQLYRAGYQHLALGVAKRRIDLAASEGALIAYEVLPSSRTIRGLAIIGLDGAEPVQQAALDYLKEESLVWSCPIITWEPDSGFNLPIS